MENKDITLIEQLDSLMQGFEQLQFVSKDWPIENGIYRQYSAFESFETSLSGTSFCL